MPLDLSRAPELKGERAERWILLNGHSAPIDVVTFSPDSRTLASGSRDGGIILWDVASGEMRHRLRGHALGTASLSFSTDGSLLLGESRAGLGLWEVETGRWLGTFPNLNGTFHVRRSVRNASTSRSSVPLSSFQCFFSSSKDGKFPTP